MARKKDLAGLASLAGLAYLASRGKGDESPVSGLKDDQYNPDVKQGPVGDFIEAGSGPGPLPDENYGNEGRREGPMAIGKVTPSAPRPAAKPMGGSGRGKQGGATAEELAAYAAGKKPLKYQSLQDRARAYEEERAKSGVGMYGTRKSTPREPLPTAEDAAYKKGGSVKGWGAARGARKAKIY